MNSIADKLDIETLETTPVDLNKLSNMVKTDTARKVIFPKSWIIMESLKMLSKYHFSIDFLDQKRLYLPSSKTLKQDSFQ